MTKAFRYTEEMLCYLRVARPLMTVDELTDAFNKRFKANKGFGAIHGICLKKGYLSDNDGCFRKGFTPWNKGVKGYMGANKTSFKKGAIPPNHVPVGTEITDNKDGYVIVKVKDPNVWKPKSHVIWEAKHGAIPAQHAIRFVDGNRLNVVIENLELISKLELLRLNKNQYSSQPDSIKPVVRVLSKLEALVINAKKQEAK
jgi:hypothetical protein